MALKAKIEKALVKAFNALQDLALPAVLTDLSDSTFDFSTRVASGESITKNVELVIVDSKKSKANTTTREILIRSTEVIDVSRYGKLVIEGESWSIGPIIYNGQFITSLEISDG